jgi:hypothetical protein
VVYVQVHADSTELSEAGYNDLYRGGHKYVSVSIASNPRYFSVFLLSCASKQKWACIHTDLFVAVAGVAPIWSRLPSSLGYFLGSVTTLAISRSGGITLLVKGGYGAPETS